MNSKYAVQVDNICQVVSIKGQKKRILSDLNLSVKQGEFIAIVGCSGAGKTTLMNILSGYHKPSRGNIYIDGLDLFEEENYEETKRNSKYGKNNYYYSSYSF